MTLTQKTPETTTIMNYRFPAFFLAAVVLALGFSEHAVAQNSPTIGYTDYELILVQMPDFRQVQQQLQTQAEGDQQALAELQTQIEQRLRSRGEEMQARLQGAQGPVTDQARQRMMQELQEEAMQLEVEARQELEQERQRRVQQLTRREAQLLEPLYSRLQEAINSVAEQRGLALVLSSRLSGEPVLLYAGPAAVDVTAEVMSQLGISMQQDN
jgi:outer membrane protein